MTTSLESLIACGTKIWLDSIDPDLVKKNHALGASGATSNPIIVGDILKTGRFDDQMAKFIAQGKQDDEIAWLMTDQLVKGAQDVFLSVWQKTKGNDGYVSFELDPLLEDPAQTMKVKDRAAMYVQLARKWSKGHQNRMIKIPATEAGIASLEEVAAAGITINVTLIFSQRQYIAARDAVWRGAQRRKDLAGFKSVYSIFVSRVDVYTEKHVPTLTPASQGLVGIVNAKQIWKMNRDFWSDKKLPLQQEMIFASTGTKKPEDPADKYVAAFAGSDIETNPPATNDAVQKLGKSYKSQIAELPPAGVLAEIEKKVDYAKLEAVLMDEGTRKFADPHKALLSLINQKRAALTPAK